MLSGVLHSTKRLSSIHVNPSSWLNFEWQIDLYLDIVFTRSGKDYMIPSPVVVKNYQTSTGGLPNQNGTFDTAAHLVCWESLLDLVDESKWTYHRRFFLIDRVSGVDASNGMSRPVSWTSSVWTSNLLVLRSVHYVKSIQVLNTLTGGTSYILPPVIVVEYAELSSSDIGQGTVVQVREEKNTSEMRETD